MHTERINKNNLQPSVSKTTIDVVIEDDVENEVQRDDVRDLLTAFVQKGYPLSMFDNDAIREVLERKFDKIPCRTQIREKVIPELYHQKVEAIKQIIRGNI